MLLEINICSINDRRFQNYIFSFIAENRTCLVKKEKLKKTAHKNI